MNADRFQEITSRYADLRIAVVGDYSCDRYLEIDPTKQETSIETGLPVHNVTNVRAQPGASGTIVSNLAALGIGEIWPVGFCGADGEGFELCHALKQLPGVKMDHFMESNEQRTFTYCKPLVMKAAQPPRELNRLDSKNWHPTPSALQDQLANAVQKLAPQVDAMIVLDQVDELGTGVISSRILETIDKFIETTFSKQPLPIIIGDSRNGFEGWPNINLKMNLDEFRKMTSIPLKSLKDIKSAVANLASSTARNIFVSMAGNGIICGDSSGKINHQAGLPVSGEIDIVGAGDAVMASLTASLAASAEAGEAIELANAAASISIHKLGTTGTASLKEIGPLVS